MSTQKKKTLEVFNVMTNKEAIKSERINHPSHYTDGGIETIDFIESKKLPYHLGNVVKYISRAGKKEKGKYLEDLKKAKWYLDRYIEKKSGELI